MLSGCSTTSLAIFVPMCAHGAFAGCRSQGSSVRERVILEVSSEHYSLVRCSGGAPAKSWLQVEKPCKINAFFPFELISIYLQDTLRRRFGNALRWYAALNDSANAYIEKEIDRTREALLRAEDAESQPSK
jgi:hypothetical protein